MAEDIISFELNFNQGSAGNAIAHNISGITLTQQINGHHSFEIKVRAEAVDGEDGALLQKSKDSIGKKIKIQLYDAVFIGFVNQVTISKKSSGFKGDLIIKGFSPGFILDDKPNTQSFTNSTIGAIVSQVKKVYPGNIINFDDNKINPQHQSKLDYVTQYNESGYHFISRLAADFGEWFYYDGTQTYFGLPDSEEPVKLFAGSDIQNFDISLQVQHIDYKMQLYDYLKNETVNKSGSDASKPDMDSLSEHAFNASKNLSGFVPQYINTEVYNVDTPLSQTATEIVNIDAGTDASQFVLLTGASARSDLKLGTVIEVRERSATDKNNEENLGDYRIISITHNSTGQGNYQNQFKAIPKALKFPPGNKLPKPFCPSQPAVVTDNHDSLGRVKVQFYWQKDKNVKTPWIRVLSSHAGNGRGFYFMPEVGDEVLICFADNDPDQPYVAGSLYHGKAKPAGNGKSIITIGGNCIVFSDEKDKQQINIYNDKNKLTLSCEDGGNITIYSDGNIDLKSNKKIRCFARDAFEAVAGSIVFVAIEDLDVDNPPADSEYYAEMTPDTFNFKLKGTFIVHGPDLKIDLQGDTINASAGSGLQLESNQKMDIKAQEQLSIDGGAMASLKGEMVSIN
jgi:type VI secretion system secreted protein VgrG